MAQPAAGSPHGKSRAAHSALEKIAFLLLILLAAWLLPGPALAICPPATGVTPPSGCTGPQCQCLTTVDKVCHPTGKILDEFSSKGGCDTFGKPLQRSRPRLAFGGRYQSFEFGEIAHYPKFVGGASTADFLLSAHQVRNAQSELTKEIRVNWGPTNPFSYDNFIVRWDMENNEKTVAEQHEDDKQQEDAGSGSGGSHTFAAPGEGTYAIYVEGCDEGFWESECKQGWSFPVYVDRLPRPLDAVPQPASSPALFSTGTGILDVSDQGKITFADRFRMLARVCGDLREGDEDRDHYGELNGTDALAWLRAADLIAIFPIPPPPPPGNTAPPHITDPLKNTKCYRPEGPLRDDVSAAILASEQVSRPGTDASGLLRTAVAAATGMSVAALLLLIAVILLPPVTALLNPVAVAIGLTVSALVGVLLGKSDPGDYDMRLIDYVTIYHEQGTDISPAARDRLVDKLLSERGGEDQRRDFFHISGIPTPIPETENHIWSTEVSRYLTNNILYDRAPSDELNNDKNGMTKWVLHGLQEFLIDDFYELNARPYSAISYHALQTLANYAAVGGGNCTQQAIANAPPQSSRCDVRRAARSVLDYVNARFALSNSGLRRAVPFRRKPEFANYPRLLTNGGDDMTWRMWAFTGGSDFLRDERYSLVMEQADGYALAAYHGYHPPLLITDLIRSAGYPGDMDVQRFRSKARGASLAEVYFRTNDYLISAGGRYEDGSGLMATLFSGEEDAWALPTTLMPLKQGEDIRDMVRIAGSTDPQERSNLCVGPGFACGMNPIMPPGIPEGCKRKEGNWTFIDFASDTEECPFGYGYYVAVYSEECDDDDCEDAAGDPEPGSFGFFEATPWRSFDTYVADVLALNDPEDFSFDKVNVYRSPTGRIITFVVESEDEKWDIVDYGGPTAMVKPEREFGKWPIAQGALVSSPRPACIFVDNNSLKQRLIIDHTDTMKPRRSIISHTLRERCGCPLIDACLSPRAE